MLGDFHQRGKTKQNKTGLSLAVKPVLWVAHFQPQHPDLLKLSLERLTSLVCVAMLSFEQDISEEQLCQNCSGEEGKTESH